MTPAPGDGQLPNISLKNPAAAGTVSVSVQNTDGQTGTRASAFTFSVILPPPTVAAISPDTGPSTGGTMVSVFGTNFQMGATVLIGGLAAAVAFMIARVIS